MTCLSNDAAELHKANPDDEIADNMLRAEGLMRDMRELLLNCRKARVPGRRPDALSERIDLLLLRT
jgi:hypothetical protein